MDLSKLTKTTRKTLPLEKCGAVIVAAGSASRMGGIDKVMAPLKGEPMILRTVRAFQACDAVKEIVVVTREDLIRPISSLCAGMDKVKAVVAGGKSRFAAGSDRYDRGWRMAILHPLSGRYVRPCPLRFAACPAASVSFPFPEIRRSTRWPLHRSC